MSKRDHINEEVQKTLAAMDNMEPLAADPYFYTRLNAKIQEMERTEQPLERRQGMLGYILPAMLVMLVAVNLFSVYWIFQGSSESGSDRESALSAFAEEYSLNQSSDSFIWDE